MLGLTHAEVGAYLLGLWGLPDPIVEAVALHHTPASVVAHEFDLLGALAVSHALLEPGSGHAIPAVGEQDPGVNESYLATLSAPFDWQEAQRRVQAIALQAA